MDDELEIKAYYAGHVLGAAMVLIKVGLESLVYTVSVNKSALCQSPYQRVNLTDRISLCLLIFRETIT